MKLVGKFSNLISNQYAKLLQSHGIFVQIEDLSPIHVPNAASRDYFINLYVSENDFAKASSLIKNFDKEATSRVEALDREVRPKIIFVFLAILIAFIIYILVCALWL